LNWGVLKNDHKKVLRIEEVGNAFKIFENVNDFPLKKCYAPSVFIRKIMKELKIIFDTSELFEFIDFNAVVELDLVNNEKDLKQKNQVFLEKGIKYGVFIVTPAGYPTPISYFIFDGENVELVK